MIYIHNTNFELFKENKIDSKQYLVEEEEKNNIKTMIKRGHETRPRPEMSLRRASDKGCNTEILRLCFSECIIQRIQLCFICFHVLLCS